MANVNLPNTSRSDEDDNLFSDVYENDLALANEVNGNLDNDNIASGASIDQSKLNLTSGISQSAKASLSTTFTTTSSSFTTALTTTVSASSSGFLLVLLRAVVPGTSSSSEAQVLVDGVSTTPAAVAFAASTVLVSTGTNGVALGAWSSSGAAPFGYPISSGSHTVDFKVRKTAGTSADLSSGTLYVAVLT